VKVPVSFFFFLQITGLKLWNKVNT